MIDRERYGRSSDGGHGPVMINIRLRRRSRHPPTLQEVHDCLQHILSTREVPEGWALAEIDWRNPSRASAGWRTGELAEFEQLSAVIQTAYQDARAAIVRRDGATLDREL